VATATPTPTPATTPPPNGDRYGSGIGADALNNTIIGGTSATQSSYRFRAMHSSALASIRVYVIANGNTGYSNGTGGTIRVGLYADDGSAAHLPSGSALTTGTLAPGNPDPSSGFHTITFGAPPPLVAGTLYHVMFTNVDASPATNYLSIDNTFVAHATTQWQPNWQNIDWAELTKAGTGSWSADRGNGSVNTPILQLAYTNGQYQGSGYMETWGSGRADGYDLMNGTVSVRETFTVSGGDRTVSQVSVRLARTSGSNPLSVRIETASGSEIETVTIPAADIPTATKGGHMFGQTWHTVSFASTHVLASGSSYNLVWSTTPGTEYWTAIIRQGTSYGYNAATYYADGRAQINSGSGWTNVKALTGAPSDQGDLQFYFH